MHGIQIFGSQPPLPIRILSHNIRFATSSPERKERPWADRPPLITNELSYYIRPYCENVIKGSTKTYIDQDLPLGPASICLQEALHGQLLDILNGLNGLASSSEGSALPSGPLWAYIGVAPGRRTHKKGT